MSQKPIRRWNTLVAVVGALAVVCLPVSAERALAKRVKSRLSAIIDARRFKSPRRGLIGIYATTSFSVNGAAKKRTLHP